MSQVDRDRTAYALARKYMLGFGEVTEQLLDRYINAPIKTLRPERLNGVFRQLIESARNRAMSGGVIGGALGEEGLDALAGLLSGFNPAAVAKQYGRNWKLLLRRIQRELGPGVRLRTARKSIWPLYCRTITSGAAFLSQFSSAADFHKWAAGFDGDDRSRGALPVMLSLEIDGLGFALACDFLKEMGYFNFGKPDVHVKAIFAGLGLVSPGAEDDYSVFKAITRVARHQRVTPYNVDKLFWLVGSGFFYNDRHLGSDGWIRTDRNKFIRWAAPQL